MKVKLLVGALVVLVLVNIAAIGTFWFMHHQGHHSHRSGREWRSQHEGKYDLSREERKRVRRAVRSIREEVRPLIDETKSLENDLIASMKKDPAPRGHIDSLHQQISAKRLEIARRATDRMIAMGDSLSTAQRDLMIDAMVRHRRSGFEARGEGSRRRHRGD